MARKRTPRTHRSTWSTALGVSILALPLLIGSCAATGPSGDASGRSLSTLMRTADATRDDGDLQSAIGLYRRAHVYYPHAVEPLVALGDNLNHIGKRREAIKAYKKALARSPADADALRGLGGIYMRLGETRLALAQYERLLAVDPNDVRALNRKGIVLDDLGRHREAQAAYRAGLEIEPHRVALRNNLGLSLALSGQHEEAIALLEPLARESDAAAEPKKNLKRALKLAEAKKVPSSNRMTAAVDQTSPELMAIARTERIQPDDVAQARTARVATEETPGEERLQGPPHQLVNFTPSAVRAAALGESPDR